MPTYTISCERVATTDLTPHIPLVPGDFHFFFNGAAGFAPYRLLAHLSTLLEGQTIVEVGVHNGWGSLVLGHNPSNRVVGYDVDLSTLSPAIREAHGGTMTFKEGLAHELDPELVLAAPLIHFDALHDGVYEQVFLDFLIAGGYGGLLVLDDIHLNPAMEHFWGGITQRKGDLTAIGHETGTGVVCFGETHLIVGP